MWAKIKDIVTDILGFGLFGLSIYMWYVDRLSVLEAVGMMLFGSLFFLISDAGLAKILAIKFGKFLDAVISAIVARISKSKSDDSDLDKIN